MTSKVYFSNARTVSGTNLLNKMDALCDAVGLKAILSKGDFTAIKLHVGEYGNLSFVSPQLVRRVVDKIKATGASAFLTDANTLYSGQRSDAVKHHLNANLNGFTMETAGAPFIVADGLTGSDYVSVPINGHELKEAKIASAIYNATSLVSISHFKAHPSAGIGGTIKNMGMGCASRAGKLIQHSDVKPVVRQDGCTGCAKCAKHCPADAITFNAGNKASIDSSKCIGCADCLAMCPARTIRFGWGDSTKALQRKMAEYAMGALAGKTGKSVFFNVIMNVSPQCDCFSNNDVPIVPDLGIMASLDPVAIDKAAADMILSVAGEPGSCAHNMRSGDDKFTMISPDSDWRVQLSHAAEIGLGSTDYEIVKVMEVK